MKYILNPDKTEELLYTASINCMTDADSAYLQMQLVYDQFARDRFNSHPPLEGKSFTINSKEKVWWKCKTCDYEWQATIQNRVLRESGCPKCAGKVVIAGVNDFATLFPDLLLEWNHEKNGELKPSMVSKGSNKTVWWVCGRGHEWKAKVESRIYGQGCPECSKNLRTSFPEQTIFYYLSSCLKVENRFKIAGWEADIFLSEYNIAIEYDGMLYHSDEKAFAREKRKNDTFAEAGIDLIRVKETPEIKNDTNNIVYLIPKSDYKTLSFNLSIHFAAFLRYY